jgi:nitrogen regulatory protein P-II 2
MKMIVAIIRPEKWDEVRAELSKHDIYLMTISDVRGCGKERGQTEVYRGTEFEEQLIPKLKLEIAVNDNFLEDAIESILVGARSGNTGAIGDGKIFVFPMEDCVRIRTGERGKTAIGP